ncbi:hypothetical protein ABFA25_06585 [Mycobacterium lepromatosis]|uniref:hypothetical protein n=1 Tax=Mycobacterium lepromatosis TaxID=480418 RepID=UPI0005F81E98
MAHQNTTSPATYETDQQFLPQTPTPPATTQQREIESFFRDGTQGVDGTNLRNCVMGYGQVRQHPDVVELRVTVKENPDEEYGAVSIDAPFDPKGR